MSDEQDDVHITARAESRAEALMDLGRYEQAISLLAKSLAETPDDDHLLCRMADAHFHLPDYEKAENFAQRALHLNPNSDHAHYRLSWIYLKNNFYDHALRHAHAAIAIDPDDASNLYTLAWAEYYSGHFKKALAAAERALELNPDNADLHELIADLYFNMDRKKEAEKHYRVALSHDPESASIHCYLGQCLAAQHKVHEASEHVLAAVKIEPANEHYRDTLFNIVHHDLMDMPLQSREKALAKLDSAVQYFYSDQLSQRGWFGKLRVTSMATLWLFILMLMMLFITWLRGDDFRKLSLVVIVLGAIYMMLFSMRLVLKFIKMRHHNRRL